MAYFAFIDVLSAEHGVHQIKGRRLKGDMRSIGTLRLKCSSCGSPEWQAWRLISDSG
jgi:hypothetical protein